MHLNAPDSPGIKRDRVVNIPLIVLCQIFQSLPIYGVGLFLPLIRKDLGLSFTEGGMLAASGIFVHTLMQIPSGYLVDRFGPKRLFFIGALGTSILSLTLGLAAWYWQAVSNQIVCGFFRALFFAPGIVLLANWLPPHRRATAMGMGTLGLYLGNAILGIIGPSLAAAFGWRPPFITFASLGILASLAFWHFGTEPPIEGRQQKLDLREVLKLFRYRAMWVCAVIQFVRLAVAQGIMFWLPSLLVDEKGLSLQLAGLMVALYALLVAPANVLGGYASDRLKNPTLVIGFCFIMLATTTALFVVANNMAALIVLIGINAFFVQMYFGPLFSAAVEIVGTPRAGISTGFSNFFANVGSLSSVYLLGAIKDATGSFEHGFYAIAGTCIVGLIFTVILARMRHQAAPAT